MENLELILAKAPELQWGGGWGGVAQPNYLILDRGTTLDFLIYADSIQVLLIARDV